MHVPNTCIALVNTARPDIKGDVNGHWSESPNHGSFVPVLLLTSMSPGTALVLHGAMHVTKSYAEVMVRMIAIGLVLKTVHSPCCSL